MAEVVDSIVAELIARDNGYIAKLNEATRAHKEFTNSIPKTDAFGAISATDAQKYVGRHRKAANDVAAAEEQTTDKVVRTRKRRSDAAKSADAADAASAKASADKRVETEEQAQARLSAAVDRGLADRAAKNRPARNSTLGRTNTYDGPAKPLFIPEASLGGKEEVAAEAEVNHALLERYDLAQRVRVAEGGVQVELRDQLEYLNRIDRYKRAGLTETQAALRAEAELAEIEKLRAARTTKSNGGRNAEQFARGAGFYAATGGPAAIAGIGVAAGVAGGITAIDSSISFAKQISDVSEATGVSTKAIQVYQAAARQAGATNEQLSASFGRLNDYVGRAKEGDQQAAKTFNALGISIKGVKSAGDVLPSVVERLSSIKDPAERAAVGTRLFGEEYRRLDAVLGQGTGKIDALGKSLERTGSILSGHDIATLKDASVVLGELKARLEVDLARVVAGNAQAILGLANAFANLADKALKAVQAIGRIKAQNAITDESAFGASSPAEKAAARTTLIADAQGRQFLLQQNSRALALNRQQSALTANSPAQFIDGKLQTPGATYQAQRRRLLADRREVLTYRDPGDITVATQAGSVNQGALNSLFAPNPPKGKSAEALAAEAEQRTKRYLDQLAGLQEAELRGQEALTGDIEKRAGIENDLADRALKKQLADIESTRKTNVDRGADPKLEQARADTLAAAAKAATATQKAGIAQEKQASLIAASNTHLQTQLSIESEQLSVQESLASTRRERLALELKALENQKQQERLGLQTQLAQLKPGDPARADVEKRLGSLDTIYAGRAQQTQEGSLSPLAAYRKQLTSAVGDTSDALEQVKVNALTRIDDQLSSTIGKVLGLKGAFGELAASIIQDLAKIEIEKAILGATGGGSGGGGIGGLFGSLAKAIGLGGGGGSSPFSAIDLGTSVDGPIGIGSIGDLLPGFANGGTATIGGNPGVDQNVLSINGKPSLRVGQGEQLSVNPVGAVNQKVAAPSSSTSIVQHFHIDASNSVNPDGFEDRILTKANGYAARAAATAGQRAAEASPAVVSRVRTLGS